MTTRRTFLASSLALTATSLTGCASILPSEWVTLIDGTRVPIEWKQLGQGNWSIVDKTILQGQNGKGGYLVSPKSYTDFEIRAEFWGDDNANSGVFIRCADPAKVGAATAYEVNIWDKRPDPSYGSGAIVDFAALRQPYPKTANRWNLFEIVARGERVTVSLNGVQTVDMINGKFKSGPVALQSAGGTIRFRKVEIREL